MIQKNFLVLLRWVQERLWLPGDDVLLNETCARAQSFTFDIRFIRVSGFDDALPLVNVSGSIFGPWSASDSFNVCILADTLLPFASLVALKTEQLKIVYSTKCQGCNL